MRKGKALDAPFAKNWPALLLKKAMIDAINDGKTHIAWADGKVHNDRYSLTRTLDDITMEPGNVIGIREIFLNTKEQGEIQLQVDGKGRVLNSDHEGFVGKGLDEVIGKQMADKILEEPSWDHKHENFRKTIKYEGKDLDLSDPALPNFYDKEVVKVATKLAKKLGVGKPEKVKIDIEQKPFEGSSSSDAYDIDVSESNGAWMMELPTKQALGEQTLYMPGLGDDAIASPGLPLITQSLEDSVKRKYSKIGNTELSGMLA
jgi:hypothetical protein